jgi:hypothetical protein
MPRSFAGWARRLSRRIRGIEAHTFLFRFIRTIQLEIREMPQDILE